MLSMLQLAFLFSIMAKLVKMLEKHSYLFKTFDLKLHSEGQAVYYWLSLIEKVVNIRGLAS